MGSKNPIIRKLREENELMARNLQAHKEHAVELRAKLERYEGAEAKQADMQSFERSKLLSENDFWRNLFRDMMIEPEVITAKSDAELRVNRYNDKMMNRNNPFVKKCCEECGKI